ESLAKPEGGKAAKRRRSTISVLLYADLIRRPRDPSTSPGVDRSARHALGTVARPSNVRVALRAIRIRLAVVPSCLGCKGSSREGSFRLGHEGGRGVGGRRRHELCWKAP